MVNQLIQPWLCCWVSINAVMHHAVCLFSWLCTCVCLGVVSSFCSHEFTCMSNSSPLSIDQQYVHPAQLSNQVVRFPQWSQCYGQNYFLMWVRHTLLASVSSSCAVYFESSASPSSEISTAFSCLSTAFASHHHPGNGFIDSTVVPSAQKSLFEINPLKMFLLPWR